MADQRRHPRIALRSPVEFFAADPRHVTFGFATDVSAGGVFVQTPFPAPRGRKVVLRVWRPGWTEEVLLRGVVRWTGAAGMGVKFTSLGRDEARVLGRLVVESANLSGGAAPPPS